MEAWTWLVNYREKECGSVYSSRLWGEALRDETKNGCEGDYSTDRQATYNLKTVIFEAKAAMHHAISAQAQNAGI